MKKLAILGSGSGSNMQAISDAIEDGTLDAEILLVASDHAEAYILERARQKGIPTRLLDCAGYKQRFPAEEQEKLALELKERGVEWICLAGFMRLIGAPLLSHFPERIINIHPSLLPLYPGLAAWEQAIADGATYSGCTVHYVDDGMDTGEIIAQRTVSVLPEDTPQTLLEKIQLEERRLYPMVLREL